MSNVKQFLEQVSRQAIEARDTGDLVTINRLCADASMRDFINNVVLLGNMTPDIFKYWHPEKYKQIESLAESYYAATAATVRVDGMAEKLDQLLGMVEALVKVQTPKQQAAIAEAVAGEAVADETEAVTPPADQAAEDNDESGEDAATEADEPAADEDAD